MARLNEAPISADSIETLKRKFLRQNRDIARSNSTQSLKIRMLESECSSLLSENLTLRSRILELEKALETNNDSRRIAGHALQLKSKMEAQLAEWGKMLAGLGSETPPKKKHCSPNARRLAERGVASRPCTGPSNTAMQAQAQRTARREMARSQEGQEGRLSTIPEGRLSQRHTLSRDEILALCTQPEDLLASPEIGPPPTSRYIDSDPVKIDSPSRVLTLPNSSPVATASTSLPPSLAAVPKLNFEDLPDAVPSKASRTALQKKTTSTCVEGKESKAVPATSRSSAKRKFGDENEIGRAAQTKDGKSSVNKPELNSRASRDPFTSRVAREPQGRGELPQRPIRQVLGPKSTNEDVASPRKPASRLLQQDVKPVRSSILRTELGTPEPPKRVVQLVKNKARSRMTELPEQRKPAAADEAVMTEQPAEEPGTPEVADTEDAVRDTPPPKEISVDGETARPSRRVRAAVSYAEPNLRDKMRRPTKELFDAVTGEGKHLRRASSTATAVPLSIAETEVSTAAPANAHEIAHVSMKSETTEPETGQSALSLPERAKSSSKRSFPSATGKAKEPSSARETLSKQLDALKSSLGLPESGEDNDKADTGDPYEFDGNSTTTAADEPAEPKLVAAKTTKAPKRLSTMTEISKVDETVLKNEPARPKVQTRKRASMAASTRVAVTEVPQAGDDTQVDYSSDVGSDAGDVSTLATRVSRRKSMML